MRTPGPWKKSEKTPVNFNQARLIRPVNDHDYNFGAVLAATSDEDADFIVEACNNYERLIKENNMLKDALERAGR
jgi:hypothetical protein